MYALNKAEAEDKEKTCYLCPWPRTRTHNGKDGIGMMILDFVHHRLHSMDNGSCEARAPRWRANIDSSDFRDVPQNWLRRLIF